MLFLILSFSFIFSAFLLFLRRWKMRARHGDADAFMCACYDRERWLHAHHEIDGDRYRLIFFITLPVSFLFPPLLPPPLELRTYLPPPSAIPSRLILQSCRFCMTCLSLQDTGDIGAFSDSLQARLTGRCPWRQEKKSFLFLFAQDIENIRHFQAIHMKAGRRMTHARRLTVDAGHRQEREVFLPLFSLLHTRFCHFRFSSFCHFLPGWISCHWFSHFSASASPPTSLQLPSVRHVFLHDIITGRARACGARRAQKQMPFCSTIVLWWRACLLFLLICHCHY